LCGGFVPGNYSTCTSGEHDEQPDVDLTDSLSPSNNGKENPVSPALKKLPYTEDSSSDSFYDSPMRSSPTHKDHKKDAVRFKLEGEPSCEFTSTSNEPIRRSKKQEVLASLFAILNANDTPYEPEATVLSAGIMNGSEPPKSSSSSSDCALDMEDILPSETPLMLSSTKNEHNSAVPPSLENKALSSVGNSVVVSNDNNTTSRTAACLQSQSPTQQQTQASNELRLPPVTMKDNANAAVVKRAQRNSNSRTKSSAIVLPELKL
jgi:hypothetical protein